jgi:hypothetical protein
VEAACGSSRAGKDITMRMHAKGHRTVTAVLQCPLPKAVHVVSAVF